MNSSTIERPARAVTCESLFAVESDVIPCTLAHSLASFGVPIEPVKRLGPSVDVSWRHPVADAFGLDFIAISAVLGGVKDIREAVEAAQGTRARTGRPTVVFVDEVHRFNKGQQDALLPHVESGAVTLVGATTENPSFALNQALISRSSTYWRTYGVCMRAVTFQSMNRTSSPCWYSRKSSKSKPCP